MKTEDDERSLGSGETGTSVMSGAVDRQGSNEVRQRNIAGKVNFEPSQDKDSSVNDRVPLIKMSESTEGTVHRIAEVQEIVGKQIGKQNGLLNGENDDGTINEEPVRILTDEERTKINDIHKSLAKSEFTLGELRRFSCSSEGLVNDDIRKVLWPKLLRLSTDELKEVEELDSIHNRIEKDVYQQILKDVARSGSHISQNASEQEIDRFYDQLTQIICWVLHKNTNLNYYQGYNDVAATVLLVMGLQSGLYVLERISLEFLERFMERTMEKVNQELFYIYALLARVHPKLLEHLENVELFPHFALAEYTTWYAHKYAENRKLLHRLYDYFLGSPPLMPLYLSTVIVAYRDVEIFNTTPDMGHTHKALCTLPPDLPIETLLQRATDLYERYPPESIINDVKEYDQKRRQKEQGWKATAEAGRKEREREIQRRKKLQVAQRTTENILRQIPKNIRTYGTGITVVTILALGLYAFLKSSAGLN